MVIDPYCPFGMTNDNIVVGVARHTLIYSQSYGLLIWTIISYKYNDRLSPVCHVYVLPCLQPSTKTVVITFIFIPRLSSQSVVHIIPSLSHNHLSIMPPPAHNRFDNADYSAPLTTSFSCLSSSRTNDTIDIDSIPTENQRPLSKSDSDRSIGDSNHSSPSPTTTPSNDTTKPKGKSKEDLLKSRLEYLKRKNSKKQLKTHHRK